MSQNLEDLPPTELMPEIAMSYAAVSDVAVLALAELARVRGLDRLDALENAAVLRVKNQPFEGLSIERDRSITAFTLNSVALIFRLARRGAAGKVED